MSVLETQGITKNYPGTVALDDVTCSFESGMVHALVGKNGSGKSTLLKIFSGAVQQTKGEIRIDGEPLAFFGPSDAMAKGIATVYQELSLVRGLSVAENILLGRLPMKGPVIDWKHTAALAGGILKDLKIDIDPGETVYNLSVGQCQMVEIAKAMSMRPKVLQLDEPTSALANSEIQTLFDIIRELKRKGIIIIYVSHRLHELWEIADTCTVLRDGRFIGSVPMQSVTDKEVVNMMFGDITIPSRPADIAVSDEVVLEVRGLTRANKFEDVSFRLRKGEIVGIAGMLGSGRTELLKAIFGADRFDRGEIWCNGKLIQSPTPEKMKSAGVAMTQEDRKNEGLNLIASIRDNLCAASLGRIAEGMVIRRGIEDRFANRQVKDLGIKAASIADSIMSLSGGNQQKVVVGSWLNTEPRIMLFDEPSRGIDVSAKQQIFQIIWEQARKGVSSVMVSSELEELLEVCHRILVMRNGKIQAEVYPEETRLDDLYALCIGGKLI